MKQILIILFIGTLSFLLGWLVHDMRRISAGVSGSLKQVDSLIRDSEEINNKQNYSIKIKGQFLIDNTTCAGFEFFNLKKIIWRNEIDCNHPDTLALFWLDNSTFITKDIKRTNENCPPRNGVYKVEKFDGVSLILKELWTG